jgi:hypothetical protein
MLGSLDLMLICLAGRVDGFATSASAWLFVKGLLTAVGRRDGWRFRYDWLNLGVCSLSLEEGREANKEKDRKEVAGFEMAMECEGEYEVVNGGEGPPKSMSFQKPQKKIQRKFHFNIVLL